MSCPVLTRITRYPTSCRSARGIINSSSHAALWFVSADTHFVPQSVCPARKRNIVQAMRFVVRQPSPCPIARANVAESDQRRITRREALAAIGGGLVALSGCGSEKVTGSSDWSSGRIIARPSTPTITPPTGITNIPLSIGVDGLLFVPTKYNASTPAPMAFLLHGAGRNANELILPVSTYAESRGLVLAAVTAVDGTWDAIHGELGPDVRNINATLDWVFARCAVDVSRLGLMGFSDGGTYSIGLGRINGDLFRRVNVFSPGFLLTVTPVGKPEFFITHGKADQVLSIDATRNIIVPQLRNAGYSVDYREWDGGHGVSAALLEQSVDWFVRK
jgi:phospholipase/carboxylesterase